MTVEQNAREMSIMLGAFAEAKGILSDLASLDDPTDEEKLIARNRILAGSGLKAHFLGTISTEPTCTQAELEQRGTKTEEAAMLIQERDQVRAEALALVL